MKLLVSALETSANVHLKALQKELQDEVEFLGIFDSHLGRPHYDITQLAVMGFVEAIKKLPFFLRLKREMVTLSEQADKVLLIDSSGFNLPLAQAIKKKYPHKKIIYYILPQAWAWKQKRVFALQRNCDFLCSILPFEQEIYPDKKKIQYVGHPLLDEIKSFKTKSTSKICTVAFMPGSRKVEIQKLMPIFRDLCRRIDAKSLLIVPEHFDDDYIQEVYKNTEAFEVVRGSHENLKKADFAFICSGTATLEAALIGTPFVLSYIAKPLDYFIGSSFVKLPYIGLANIFFEKMGKAPLHEEFVQSQVSVEALYQAFLRTNTQEFFEKCQLLREYLGHGSSKTVAQVIKS